jgi:hypothetical protein
MTVTTATTVNAAASGRLSPALSPAATGSVGKNR